MSNTCQSKISNASLLLLAFLLIFLQGALVTHAAISVPGGNPELQNAVNDLNQLSNQSPITEASGFLSLLAKITQWTYTIFFIIAIIFILFAAFKYLTASGEEEAIKTVHRSIRYAVIAIAIALISVGATAIIDSFIRGSGAPATTGTQGNSAIDNRNYGPTSQNIQNEYYPAGSANQASPAIPSPQVNSQSGGGLGEPPNYYTQPKQ